jgi:hypothetical protein
MMPARVYRVEIESGKRTLIREIMPADPAGVPGIPIVVMTRNAKSYAHARFHPLDELYIAEGLR